MVNFHGSNKPTGEDRTWPNELTREAVRGMEASRLQMRAQHDVTLPFTRLLAGPADYTPVHFGLRRGDTTIPHQIASAAILTSPMLTYAASPRNLLASPFIDMIKSIPSVWDETIVLPESEIGEIAAFAHRKGETWFLAIMNGSTPKSLRVYPTFLARRSYRAQIISDDSDEPQESYWSWGRRQRLRIDLPAGGGFIARFLPSD